MYKISNQFQLLCDMSTIRMIPCYTIPIKFILDIDIKPEPKEKPILEEVKVEPIKVESHYEEIFEKPFQISPAPLTNHPIVIEEPLHDNENKPKVLESIPDLENNKIHPILEPSKGKNCGFDCQRIKFSKFL